MVMNLFDFFFFFPLFAHGRELPQAQPVSPRLPQVLLHSTFGKKRVTQQFRKKRVDQCTDKIVQPKIKKPTKSGRSLYAEYCTRLFKGVSSYKDFFSNISSTSGGGVHHRQVPFAPG